MLCSILQCRPLARSGWLLALATALAAGVQAHEVGPRVPVLPLYQQECGACHLAYPVSMLPATSWQRIMAGLDQHFGSDASLDAPERRRIGHWLRVNAGTFDLVREAPAQNRISKSAWFVQRHAPPRIPSALWQRAAVGRASNCAACHTKAAQGSYLQPDIRLPK